MVSDARYGHRRSPTNRRSCVCSSCDVTVYMHESTRSRMRYMVGTSGAESSEARAVWTACDTCER